MRGKSTLTAIAVAVAMGLGIAALPAGGQVLLPPLVAIGAALVTQRLFAALLAGVLVGAGLLTDWQPRAWFSTAAGYGWEAVVDPDHLQIFLFSACLLGMVNVVNRMGGTRGLIDAFTGLARTRRSAQLAAYLMGLGIFFDDYASTVVVGSSMRPIADRLRISREKLAYLCDTMAAPVASTAVISTWIGYQLGLLQPVMAQVGLAGSPFTLFLQALPYRFYCIFAVLLLLLVVLTRRDIGPMYQAERRAITRGEVLRPGAKPLTSRTFGSVDVKDGIPCRWQNAVWPVLVLVVTTLIGLFVTGGGAAALRQDLGAVVSLTVWRDAFANGSSGLVLSWASVLGSLVAVALALGQRLLTPQEVLQSWGKGAVSMWMAVLLLTLAWTLNGICANLGTAGYLVTVTKGLVSPFLLPALLFVMSAAVTFSVGSSWSAMAILIPTTLPLAYEAGTQAGLGGAFFLALAAGAVLDGAIFGDHCSPLADTTVMTSITTACDHLDHVRTQLPYGLLGALVAAVCGYLPAACGWSAWWSYALGGLALLGTLVLVGRNAEVAAETAVGEPLTPSTT